jgi:hypothetical protein
VSDHDSAVAEHPRQDALVGFSEFHGPVAAAKGRIATPVRQERSHPAAVVRVPVREAGDDDAIAPRSVDAQDAVSVEAPEELLDAAPAALPPVRAPRSRTGRL